MNSDALYELKEGKQHLAIGSIENIWFKKGLNGIFLNAFGSDFQLMNEYRNRFY